MNENMLEIHYSARMDELDRKLTRTHELDQSSYDDAVAKLNAEYEPKFERARVLAKIQF